MVIKSTEGFLIKFCAFRRRSVSGGEERNVSNYGRFKKSAKRDISKQGR